jgi:hypothetical protein
MIRIEQFLFEYNVERTQAESLIERFRNLTFATNQEFVDYFDSQNITLGFENKVGVAKTTFQQKDELLQKFKDFKSSTDYDYVKKYIAEQRRIQAAIDSGNIQNSSNLLDGITSQPVDPFFNFIVRKMLTGSETGVLPSESLRSLLDELTKKTKQDIDTTVAVTRDELGRVISFDNYLRNKGSLRVDLLDERFTLETFNYVVNKGFNQLQDAVDAEKNVLRRAAELDTIFPDDATGDGVVDNRDLVENLKKLIVADSNSVPALQSKLESLQNQLSNLNELVDVKDSDVESLNRIIEELSAQRNITVDESAIKDETIIALNEVIDATLAELEDKVSQQLTNTTDAFDALSTQIEAQAKKSEEAAAKQLAAFEKAVGGIADALKPAEPEPEPGDSPEEIERKNTIKSIQSAWEKILYINTSNDDTLLRVLTLLKAETPIQRQKFVDLGGNMSSRIKQIVDWNNLYKKQYRSLLTSENIKTLEDTKSILKDINTLETKTNGFISVRTFIYDQAPGQDPCTGDLLDKWRNDCIRGRGSNEEKIREIYGILGVTWENGNTENIEAALRKTTNDQFLEILNILSELPTKY